MFRGGPAVSAAFPSLRLGGRAAVDGVLDRGGGIIMADKALSAARAAAAARGCSVLDGFPVEKIVPRGAGAVDVVGGGGRTLSARGVVICAGAWTNKLLEPIGSVLAENSSLLETAF